MKKLLMIALFFAAAFSTLWSKEVKLLTIGNSFADSAFKYLPQVAASVPDCDLVMERANHKSWRPETYQPFAKNIKEYVNKNAPSAEVVLQQT